MKVLVLGGGQIAKAVATTAPHHHEVLTRFHSELDIAAEQAVSRTISNVKADWVVNAAAFTSVDLAEDRSTLAHAVNGDAVAFLARACEREGSRFLHLSTDFVFDGRSNRAYLPDDVPGPLSVYGASKLVGERYVQEIATSGIVLRTSWVYATSGRNFVLTMLRLMREKDRIEVVYDQIGTPTSAASAASAVWGLIEKAVPGGIYHWSDLGVASWYDFAVAIQDEALSRGLLQRAIMISPVSSNEYPTRARRPAFSVLDSAGTRKSIGEPGTYWRHNLRTMLDDLRML